MCACTGLTENLGNRLAPRSHTAQVSKCPKEYSFVCNESLSRILSIVGARVSAAVNQWSPREAGGLRQFTPAEGLALDYPQQSALKM